MLGLLQGISTALTTLLISLAGVFPPGIHGTDSGPGVTASPTPTGAAPVAAPAPHPNTRTAAPTAIAPAAVPGSCSAAAFSNAALLADTNAGRTAAGLPPLRENAQLDSAATMKADDMITAHYWGHVSPTGVTPWVWIARAGYPFSTAAENLAQGTDSPDGTLLLWMASPEHRANILNPAFRDVGFSVVCGVTDSATTLVVAEYGAT